MCRAPDALWLQGQTRVVLSGVPPGWGEHCAAELVLVLQGTEMGGLLLSASGGTLTAGPGESSPPAQLGLSGGGMCVPQAWLAGAGRVCAAGRLASSLLPAETEFFLS